MNTCNTCKYWAYAYKVSKGMADCGAIEDVKENFDSGAYIKTAAADDQGLSATLFTGKDFGCVLHKPKNNV